MITVTEDQRTDDWHAARCGKVTASRFKDVLSRNKPTAEQAKAGKPGNPSADRTAKDVYNLVQRGMLENVGTRRFGRFLVVPGTSLEPVREFRASPEIIQAASVWEYARRCAMEIGRAHV